MLFDSWQIDILPFYLSFLLISSFFFASLPILFYLTVDRLTYTLVYLSFPLFFSFSLPPCLFYAIWQLTDRQTDSLFTFPSSVFLFFFASAYFMLFDCWQIDRQQFSLPFLPLVFLIFLFSLPLLILCYLTVDRLAGRCSFYLSFLNVSNASCRVKEEKVPQRPFTMCLFIHL